MYFRCCFVTPSVLRYIRFEFPELRVIQTTELFETIYVKRTLQCLRKYIEKKQNCRFSRRLSYIIHGTPGKG